MGASHEGVLGASVFVLYWFLSTVVIILYAWTTWRFSEHFHVRVRGGVTWLWMHGSCCLLFTSAFCAQGALLCTGLSLSCPLANAITACLFALSPALSHLKKLRELLILDPSSSRYLRHHYTTIVAITCTWTMGLALAHFAAMKMLGVLLCHQL
jgi:hypothetical protein